MVSCWCLSKSNKLPLGAIFTVRLGSALGHLWQVLSFCHIGPVLDHVDEGEDSVSLDVLMPPELLHRVVGTSLAQMTFRLHGISCRVARRCCPIACSHVDRISYMDEKKNNNKKICQVTYLCCLVYILPA